MRVGGDHNLMIKIFAAFCGDYPIQIREIRKEFAHGNPPSHPDEVIRLVHGIKGAAAAVGAHQVAGAYGPHALRTGDARGHAMAIHLSPFHCP